MNKKLDCLYLDNNQIQDAGAIALAKALENNSILDHLDLGCNQISDPGATALVNALENN